VNITKLERTESGDMENKMSEQEDNMYVATVVRDDFFNDPFFKDWWADFDVPMAAFNRQTSETPRRTLVDSFRALKEGKNSGHTYQQTGSSENASMQLKNGIFRLEVDLQDFEPEDIDISVEGGELTLTAKREVKRGNSSSFREFKERFAIPEGVDITQLSSEITGDGILVISGPQVKDVPTVSSIPASGDVDVSSSSEGRNTSSESSFEVEGGRGTTKRNEASNKTRKESTTKRVTDDGWEEEIYEEYEEEEVKTKSTTLISANGSGGVNVPVSIVEGGMGGKQNVQIVSSSQNIKAKDGKILEMDNHSNRRTETKEIIIPIQIEGQPQPQNHELPKTPKPRVLPFQFPTLSLPEPAIQMPSMALSPFDMSMPSATDMMAQMQMQMQQQMAQTQMHMAQMHQANMLQMEQMQRASQMQLQQAQLNRMSQNYTSQQDQEQAYKTTQNLTIEDADDFEDQDFYVPLKHIEQVQKSALSEATAMAKMRDEMFELVVQINGFDPEDVQIFCVDQAVYVKAKHVTEQGFVNNVYEQKFNLPDDVDTDKMTSGMSMDGILMIRVPRRESPERIIPIQREMKMEAVRKGLAHCMKYDVEVYESSAEQIQAEFQEKHIEPLNVDKPEDAVKAASAEVIEQMTVGVSQSAGADAGEASGSKSAAEQAQKATMELIAAAVHEVVTQIGYEIAGEAGVKVALEAALNVGTEIGAKVAMDMGAELGAEVGRIAGGQAASVAGAEELAKVNMAEITEEKAREMKSFFEELGVKIGGEAGHEAGKQAGNSMDPTIPIKEATNAAKDVAEAAALKVKELYDLATEEAKQIGAKAGEQAGKQAGETAGENVAVEQAILAAKEIAIEAATAIISDLGIPVGENVGATIGESVARKMGREMGGSAGLAAGRFAGMRASVQEAETEAKMINPLQADIDDIAKLIARVREIANVAGKKAGSVAGTEAGSNIDIGNIIADVLKAAKKAAKEQALEIKAFESMCSDIAKEAGEKAGERSGKEAGGMAGVQVAIETVMTQAVQSAAKAGEAIFGEEGAICGKAAGEVAAREVAEQLGKKLGEDVGRKAGCDAGGAEGCAKGKLEASKLNVFNISSDQLDVLKKSMAELGSNVGFAAGKEAGREAGSKIDVPFIMAQACAAAVKASEEAASMAKASGQEAQAKELENMAINCAVEAGSKIGEEMALKAALDSLEDFIRLEVDKTCEEAGALKGRQIFGDFGEKVGIEAGLIAGRKAALEKAKILVLEIGGDEGRQAGGLAGEKVGKDMVTQQNFKMIRKEKTTELRNLFTETGAKAGMAAGISISKSILANIDMEQVLSEAKREATSSAEKYSIKAREFQKLAMKIAEEAGCNAGEESGEEEGGIVGEEAGGAAGEKAGSEAGRKAGKEIAGEEGERVGAAAGAKAGLKFGLKVGREVGLKEGAEVGRVEGKKAGKEAGATEALRVFTIGITKERVAALRKTFAEVGAAAGMLVGKGIAKLAAAKKGEEEGSKFGLEQGRKAGIAAARKLKDSEGKKLKEEGIAIGEKTGTEAGAKSGASAGEKTGGDEAARLGGDEGERVGREIAGDEGARIGREVGAEAARQAGARHGRKVGKLAGIKAGVSAAKIACIEHATLCSREISREKVTAMRKLFAEIASGAACKAALAAARAEVMRSIHEIAIRAAGKAAREKILAMASKGQIRLSSDWRPTSLIAVINARTDLTDIEKVKLSAKAKRDGNISDLLTNSMGSQAHADDPLVGKLKFSESCSNVEQGNIDAAGRKWKTVVFSDISSEQQKRNFDMSQDNVTSLKKRFETKNMKNNEAYVIL